MGGTLKSVWQRAMASIILLAMLPLDVPAEPLVVPTDKVTLFVETLADGLDHPWAIEILPDGALLITERSGHLKLYRDGRLTEVKGVPAVWAKVQGGLLDVALSKDFKNDSMVFFTATALIWRCFAL